MAVLPGSQARKTGNEKELILVRVERFGIPVYFIVWLLDTAAFGGTNVDVIRKGLDSVFEIGNIPIEDYQTNLVSATADEANMNLGIYGGALTMIVEQNPWLVTILCVNHRLELAIKDAISDINKFQDCDKFYLPLFFSFWKLWQIENSN